jgi:hypothetical protein
MRVRPRRETRGVSRSKCGDLITACVPVSWATSIIVNESTDAIDFYDGFGTTELVIGVRAYQWGWEYYYPKDIDLNYNVKKNYSTFIGNSVKYNSSTSLNLKTNSLWKFYQNKSSDNVVLPAHFFLFSFDNYKILNFLNFSEIGSNVLQETAAFKKTKSFFKFFTLNTFIKYSSFNVNYKKLSNLYFNELNFFNSQNFSLKRQHNLLSLSSKNNAHFTFLNLKSFKKLLTYNFETRNELITTPKQNSIAISPVVKLFNLYFTKITNKNSNFTNLFFFEKNQTYPKILAQFNNDSDKKKTLYPIFKTLAVLKKTKTLSNFISDKTLKITNSFFYFQKNENTSAPFVYKNYTPFSPNQAIPLTERHLRNFTNTPASLASEHYTFKNNTLINYDRDMSNNLGNNLNFLHKVAHSNWIDLNVFVKLTTNKLNFDSPVSPIPSNLSYLKLLEYDQTKTSTLEKVPTILQGKEDGVPNFITSAYWNFYWNNKTPSSRISNDFRYFENLNNFYFPVFNFAYDYDFRNWQSMELLEDSFWETSFIGGAYEEYVEIFNDCIAAEDYTLLLENYNTIKFDIINEKTLDTLVISKNKNFEQLFAPYFDESLLNPSLLGSSHFFIFPLISGNDLGDTYESLKFSTKTFSSSFKNIFNVNLTRTSPLSHAIVSNMFRSDYDDLNWYSDTNAQKQVTTFPFFSESFNVFFLDYGFSKDTIDKNTNFNLQERRFDNSINLRSTTKDSMVTYNALQKVFRTRLDEGRSNTKLIDFSNSYLKQPYLTSLRVPYENLLGKDKVNFYKTNFYKARFYSNFDSSYELWSGLNYYVYDFPFLLGAKSDASRHVWFDWFAKWGFYEVQPSSSARYAIHGLPHFNKFFNFTSNQNEILNESESYFLRLSKARKNYLPGWSYTPYFYAKNNHWFKNNVIFHSTQNQLNLLSSTQLLLKDSLWYFLKLKRDFNDQPSFFPATSNINSYTKTAWKPSFSVSSYYFNMSNLTDILTRREQLYRQYLSSRKLLLNLPSYVANSPQNPLTLEIKTMFNFVDPLFANNEYSRELHYNSLTMFNFYIFKTLFSSNSKFNNLTELFYFYFFNNNEKIRLSGNSDLLKNQYRPLRKGINNMLRLHATGAVAMPIEIRLQILASSKDVIHSWAIPSAGIKIDCVPGYSSHKVMIFLVSGIFWGQCMEICGRYHHWMPIVVYFMKRDLFFLWCTHFVFSTNNSTLGSNDRQFIEHTRLVSYDKNSWLSELIN